MRDKGVENTTRSPDLIAERYGIEEKLGKGGMAEVYRVTDAVTKKSIALKRLCKIDQPHRQKRIIGLFEREYYTLAQLVHPRVVDVYDYGMDGHQPYYTMELLDGGDLHDLSPLPWQRVSALACDVCSAVGLLHSRRLIHKDITTRNVRCTQDSKAKLIDFGAMVPIGPCKNVIGTPSYTAPEVVAMQFLDTKVDLYSLGATLYYALTGRDAYPARSFDEVRIAWRRKPQPPSIFVEVIPKELDNLVLSMIDLDPLARPVSVAEVIDKLSAIAGLEIDDQLLVSQSYLLKPTLVGRDEEISKIRKHIIRSSYGSGSAVVVEGSSGVGRSRLLDACVLEGRLAGAAVLRADAADAQAGSWGVMAHISKQILNVLPEIAFQTAKPFLPVLCHILPELLKWYQAVMCKISTTDSPNTIRETTASDWGSSLDHWPSTSEMRLYNTDTTQPNLFDCIEPERFEDPQELRPRIQAALRDWLIALSKLRNLLVVVDDIHRIDEPSAAFIALFAIHLTDKRVVLIASRDIMAVETSALTLLSSAGTRIQLRHLSQDQTTMLLGSIFGEVPELQLLSDRLYKVSEGNPGTLLKFAQHLVDKEVIRYGAGNWILPHQIDVSDMPDSLISMLKIQIAKLSHNALKLAQSWTFNPERSFSFDECMILMGSRDKALGIQILSELQFSGIVVTDGHRYTLNQPGWIAILSEGLDDHRRRSLHLSLAEVFIGCGNQVCRAAKHLFEAGQEERALDLLLADLQVIKQKIEGKSHAYSEYVLSLPKEWFEIYERALSLCKRLARPRKQRYLLQVMIVRISDHSGLENTIHVTEVIDQLVHDSGLQIYNELDESIDAETRLFKAMELTQQRYETCPDADRVLSPNEAISDLVKTISNVIGIAAISYDYEILDSLPSMKPFVPLSQALGILDKSVWCTKSTNSGHLERSRQGFLEVLQKIAQPDRCGLDDTTHRYIDLGHRWGLGLIEASLGIRSAIKWADEIETHPLHLVNAWRIRLVYYLRQGDIRKAEECKKKMEILQIQNSPTQFYEGLYRYAELTVNVVAEDLMGVKRSIKGLEFMAGRFSPWVPILHFARGEYQRIRGDYRNALVEHETALSRMTPGRHLTWMYAASAYIKTLFELGRVAEAKLFGEQALQTAEDVELDRDAIHIKLALAMVQANLGEFHNAIRYCQEVIDRNHTLGATGLNSGVAFETRAFVAILMDDEEGFDTYAKLCAEQYRFGNYPVLNARYERLIQKAQQASLCVYDPLHQAVKTIQGRFLDKISDSITDLMVDCRGLEDRARRVLEFLVEKNSVSEGYLFTMQQTGPVLSAQLGNSAAPEDIDRLVHIYIQAEKDGTSEVTMTVTGLQKPLPSQFDWPSRKDSYCHPIMLGHDTDEGYVISALAILYIEMDKEYILPMGAVGALSRTLIQEKDVISLLVSD